MRILINQNISPLSDIWFENISDYCRFTFQIITDLHAALRYNTEGSCVSLTQFSPKVTFYRIRDHNQGVDTDMVHRTFPLPQESFMLLFYCHSVSCLHPLLNSGMLICSSFLQFCQFQEYYINRIVQYKPFDIGFFHSA